MSNNIYRQTIFPILTLFTSVGTLLCCALPALLVTLGAGAALAGFISVAPWITAISKYKVVVFVVAKSSYFLWTNAPCDECMFLFSLYTIIISIIIYIVGFSLG